MLHRKKQRTIILAWLLLALTPAHQADTTLVAIRTPERIIIAADSLAHLLQPPYTAYLKCKIIQAEGVFFAAAGITANASKTFDVQVTAITAAKSGGGVVAIARRFEDLIRDTLKRQIEGLRKQDPSTYQKKVNQNDRIFLSILVAGLENNRLIVHSKDFRATHTDPNPIDFVTDEKTCPGDCQAGVTIFSAGESEKILAFMKHEPGLEKSPIDKLARKLVELEIDGKSVGLPIDILEITKRGTKWIQHKQQCPDIQNQVKYKPVQPSASKKPQIKKKPAPQLRRKSVVL